MADAIDPKGLKTLSDILALVLEDQPGGSEAALAAVRRRARQNGVTGGALKEMFQRLHEHPAEALGQGGAQVRPSAPPPPPPPPPSQAEMARSVEQLRFSLRDMQRRFVEARMQLDRERREAEIMRERLSQLEDASSIDPASGLRKLNRRTRITDLERQLRHTDELTRKLAHSEAELSAARAQLANAGLSLDGGRVARLERWRLAAVLAVLAVLCLSADGRMVVPHAPSFTSQSAPALARHPSVRPSPQATQPHQPDDRPQQLPARHGVMEL